MPQNEITKVLSKRLEELTERKRDNDYKLSDKKQAEQMGIPYATFVKYKGDNAECPASAIVKMAEYYEVSTDYLLGRTNNPSADMKFRKACDYMGISQRAGENIKAITQSGGNVDILLERDEFKGIVDLLNIIEISSSANRYFYVRSTTALEDIDHLNINNQHMSKFLNEMYCYAIVKTVRNQSEQSMFKSRQFTDQMVLAEYQLTEKVIRPLIDNIENDETLYQKHFKEYDLEVESKLDEALLELQNDLASAQDKYDGAELSKKQDEMQNNIKALKSLIDFHNKKYNGKGDNPNGKHNPS